MAPKSYHFQRANSTAPPPGLVGGAIGAAIVLIAVLAFLAFVFWRWGKKDHQERLERPQLGEKPRTPFNFSLPQPRTAFKLPLLQRFRHRRTDSDALRLEPLLSAFQPPTQSTSRVHSTILRYRSLDLERHPHVEDVRLVAPDVALVIPSLNNSKDNSRPLLLDAREGAKNSSPPLANDLTSTSHDTNRDPSKPPDSPSRSSFTLSRYLPSLIIPMDPSSPLSASAVPSSHFTPGSGANHEEALSSSSARDSSHAHSIYGYYAGIDNTPVPAVPPLDVSTEPLERSETLVVTHLLKNRVGRVKRVLSNAYAGSPRTSTGSISPGAEGAENPPNSATHRGHRSTRRRPSKASNLEKRVAKAEYNARSPQTKGWRAHESPILLPPVPPVPPPSQPRRVLPVPPLPSVLPPNPRSLPPFPEPKDGVQEPPPARPVVPTASLQAVARRPSRKRERRGGYPPLVGPTAGVPPDRQPSFFVTTTTTTPLNLSIHKPLPSIKAPSVPPRAMTSGPRPVSNSASTRPSS